MPIRKLRPRKQMDSRMCRQARAAVERLWEKPVTEGTVVLRLAAMPRHQFLALCALAGGGEPHMVIDFAMRITGLRQGRASARRRLEELGA
jgi:hypothetical protein